MRSLENSHLVGPGISSGGDALSICALSHIAAKPKQPGVAPQYAWEPICAQPGKVQTRKTPREWLRGALGMSC